MVLTFESNGDFLGPDLHDSRTWVLGSQWPPGGQLETLAPSSVFHANYGQRHELYRMAVIKVRASLRKSEKWKKMERDPLRVGGVPREGKTTGLA